MPRRPWLFAVLVAVLAMAITVVGSVWLIGVLDDEPEYDGTFVLTEPGIFDEPADDLESRDLTAERLPGVAVETVDGDEVRLDEPSELPRIVNVWFSTCPPCARELADFAEIDAEFGDRVEIVGVNPIDTDETMLRFAAERGVDYELFIDDDFEWVRSAGIVSYPVTYFVDTSGRVVAQTGEIDANELRARLANLFSIRPTDS